MDNTNIFELRIIDEIRKLNCEHVQEIVKKYEDKRKHIEELEEMEQSIQKRIKELYNE